MEKNIPVVVLNSRRPEIAGTRIVADAVPCAVARGCWPARPKHVDPPRLLVVGQRVPGRPPLRLDDPRPLARESRLEGDGVVRELRAPLSRRPARRHRAALPGPQRLRPRPDRRREPRQLG